MGSRLTFRDAQDHTAWQKQLRDHYLTEGVPPVPHLNVKQARIRAVTRKMAEQIILKYEWLGTMANTRQHYGIFFGLHCAGITCTAIGTGTGGVNVPKEFHLKPQEVALLARGACVHWAPPGANSKLVSWTCRLLGQDTQAKIVIAYSDTDAGEIGTIYQACNWTYIGIGASVEQYIAPNGRIYDQKLVYNLRKQHGLLESVSWRDQRQALLDNGWTVQKTNPKHRYAWVLDKNDKALVDRVARMAQPYPKRDMRAAEGSTLATS